MGGQHPRIGGALGELLRGFTAHWLTGSKIRRHVPDNFLPKWLDDFTQTRAYLRNDKIGRNPKSAMIDRIANDGYSDA